MTIYNVQITADSRTGSDHKVFHFDSIQTTKAFIKGIIALMGLQMDNSFSVFLPRFRQFGEFNPEEIYKMESGDLEEFGFPEVFAEIHFEREDMTEQVCYMVSLSKYDTM